MQGMWAVTTGGPGLVAVGLDGLLGSQFLSTGGVPEDAAVWTSVDGVTWGRVPHDESVFGGHWGQGMLGVVAGGPGLIAVGYDGQSAAVWTSVDGVTWSRVPHDEAAFGGAVAHEMRAVVVGGPGLVAVGTSGRQGYWDAAVWTSPEGITWQRVVDDAVFGGLHNQGMVGVSAGGPGLVAVGYDGSFVDQIAAVWNSPDGITWTRVIDDGGFGELHGQGMVAVVAVGPGFVAVGADMSSGDWGSAAVWTGSLSG
jgi:hypothetical protein